MKMYYFKRPKYTSPHTYACISIHILAFPRSGGYFYLPRPLTVTHWSLPSQINFFHKMYSLFLNTVKTNNTFFHSLMTQPFWLGPYWLSSCKREIQTPFSAQLGVSDTCPILISGQPMPPPKSPCDESQHKVVLGCMRRAHFLMPPLALLNHLVRGYKQWRAWL